MFEGFWGLSADGAIAKPFLKGSQRQSLKCSDALEGTGWYRGSLTVSDFIHFHMVFFPSEHIACWWSVEDHLKPCGWHRTNRRCFALPGDPKLEESLVVDVWDSSHGWDVRNEAWRVWLLRKNEKCVWSRCIAHVISTGVTGSLR